MKNMRIAIIHSTFQEVGGIQTYLHSLISELLDRGNMLCVLCEENIKNDLFPSSVDYRCVSEIGSKNAIEYLNRWKPDVIYAHGLQDIQLETKILEIAPAVFFVHDYRNTCISGNKMFQTPKQKPCNRKFGWQCLLRYYPNRCGGWNLATMLKLYGNHSAHLQLLGNYNLILTHSNHMRQEILNHGFDPNRVQTLPFPITAPPVEQESGLDDDVFQLVFLGRMNHLKGGDLLIDALPMVLKKLSTRMRLILAGDGPSKKEWQEKAARLMDQTADIEIQFPGIISREFFPDLFRTAHLIVVPSIWPEPFGSVGLEAGLYGVPAAAFSTGGIPEWLHDGINGTLATEISTEGLAKALIVALEDPLRYREYRRNAKEISAKYSMDLHLKRLMEILGEIVR